MNTDTTTKIFLETIQILLQHRLGPDWTLQLPEQTGGFMYMLMYKDTPVYVDIFVSNVYSFIKGMLYTLEQK